MRLPTSLVQAWQSLAPKVSDALKSAGLVSSGLAPVYATPQKVTPVVQLFNGHSTFQRGPDQLANTGAAGASRSNRGSRARGPVDLGGVTSKSLENNTKPKAMTFSDGFDDVPRPPVQINPTPGRPINAAQAHARFLASVGAQLVG